MKNFWRDIRLIPIVLIASVCLLALKVSGLVFDGGYTMAERMQGRDKTDMKVTTRESVPDYPKITVAESAGAPPAPSAPKPWAQEMFNFNGKGGSAADDTKRPSEIARPNDIARINDNNRDITGSVGASEEKKDAGPPLKTSDKPPDPPKLEVGGATYPMEPGRINSPGERAILERLQDRRQELDSRNRELEMRESLLKAAEKRLDAKVIELKNIEGRVSTATESREKADVQRFKGIVSMYENMKPKEAARIFDRLDIRILVEVATTMNNRKMAEILAQMTPDAAERLTVELANRAGAQPTTAAPDQLPKIEGRPRGS